MSQYKDKVVVITGAANGIGKELASRFAAQGAKLSLADIDSGNLAKLEKELAGKGAEVMATVLDVSDFTAMENFAKKTFAKFGSVDYLFNNAGVIAAGTIWELPLSDWEWMFGVNVMGVVHGIKTFVPEMMKQDKESCVINTASLAGMVVGENLPVYVASKFAALSLTEVFDIQLQDTNSKVRAYAICPGIVQTDLKNCKRHRPANLTNDNDAYYKTADFKTKDATLQESFATGITVEKAVDTIFEGIEKGTFYIMTHPEYNPLVSLRVMGILKGTRPVKFQK